MTDIRLTDITPPRSTKITQLFKGVELFSTGEPGSHTLFVMAGSAPLARGTFDLLNSSADARNQLLLIDPPPDAQSLFRLDGDVAAIFTGTQLDVGLPILQRQPGGVAHIRIGDHFLDIYSHGGGTIVMLPALGILCGGGFASDVALPAVGPHTDGSEELETLRLLARLVKQRTLQLYIPHVGALCQNGVDVMQRLAADVAYLHGLRRVIPTLAQRNDGLEHALEIADSLLPDGRCTLTARQRHQENVLNMMAASEVR